MRLQNSLTNGQCTMWIYSLSSTLSYWGCKCCKPIPYSPQVLHLAAALEFNMLGVPYCVLLAYIEARACHNNAKEDDSCLNTDHQNSSPTTKKLDINFAAENIKSDLFWILSTSCPPLQFHSNEFHFDLREFRIR